MNSLRSLSDLLSVFYILFIQLRYHTAEAQAFELESAAEKRYYHHEVHLDESKHNDEFFSFVTRPDLDAPRWEIEVFDEDAITPGYWFAAPYSSVDQNSPDAPWNAPHIYDSNGDLIWSGAAVFDGFTTFDFRVTNILGTPMLSIIYPREGQAIIFDSSYQIHKIVDLGQERLEENESTLNMHEFRSVEDGTRILHLNRLSKCSSLESAAVIGFDKCCFAIFDGIVELDAETWQTVHTWNSEGHIGLDESFVTSHPVEQRCTDSPWDFFHANSIDKFPNGDYLVSGRRTNAIYRISRTTGEILWRLGGKKSDFQVPLEFSGQHAVNLYEENATHIVISFLDNAFLPPGVPQITNPESRGLLMALDTTTMVAHLITEFPRPDGEHTKSRGNMQMLPSNNAWICWTGHAMQTEHTIDGTLLMKAQFKAKIQSYRTFKFPWIGKPNYPPDIHSAVIDKNGDFYTIVHMSWNGATEVRDWKIYHTNAEGTKRDLVATIPRRGFETSAWTEGYAEHVFAEALDENGAVLGASNVFSSLPPRDPSQTGVVSSSGFNLQVWISNSPVAFVFGIALGGSIGAFMARLIISRSRARKESSLKWAKQGQQVYEPLIVGEQEDEVELDAFDEVDHLPGMKTSSESLE